jgi:hypothetical protein
VRRDSIRGTEHFAHALEGHAAGSAFKKMPQGNCSVIILVQNTNEIDLEYAAITGIACDQRVEYPESRTA